MNLRVSGLSEEYSSQFLTYKSLRSGGGI